MRKAYTRSARKKLSRDQGDHQHRTGYLLGSGFIKGKSHPQPLKVTPMKFSAKTLLVAVAVAFAATACETKTAETTTTTTPDATTTATVVTDSTMTPMSAEEAGAKMDAAGNKVEGKMEAAGAKMDAKMDAAGAKMDAAGAKMDAKMEAAGAKMDAMGNAAAKSAKQTKENMKDAMKK